MATHRSLLNHRYDLETLHDYWIQFAETQTQHCGYCHLNRSGWPPNGSESAETHSLQCSCNEIFQVSTKSRNIDLPRRVLLLLGREDFLANREGRLPKKDRFRPTDNSLLGAFPSLIRGHGGCLPEEQDCNIRPATIWNEFSPQNTTSSLATNDDQDGLLDVEKSSSSRFSEDERIHEVCHFARGSVIVDRCAAYFALRKQFTLKWNGELSFRFLRSSFSR
jgi:hypothetical protein